MDDQLFTERIRNSPMQAGDEPAGRSIGEFRLSRRRFVRAAATLAGTAAFGSALAACGSANPTNRTAIATWDWWVSQSPWLDNEVKQFAQAHGSLQVKRTINATSSYDRLFTLAQRS